MYLFELATTGTISFGDFVSSAQLVSQVAEATQLRARVRAVLKEHRAGASTTRSTSSSKDSDLRSGTDAEAISASDWMRIVTALEEYLPSVVGVFNCVQTDDLLLRYEPVFSWRTSISSTRFRGPQRVELPGLHYELAWVLVTYALALANFAAATVHGLGAFERDRSLSADERRVKDERLRWGADTLCRASGVLVYVSEELLPQWRDAAGAMDVPPDLTGEATLALSKICMAEAQALAIRKLVSPSVASAVDTVTPGPPLPKSHPSVSLLAKLHLHVVEELESALGLLKTLKDRGGNRSGRRDAVGLSANHEHELARRVSATNEDLVPGADKKKMFGKLRLGKDKAKDDVPSATTGVGGDLDVSSSLLAHVRSSLTLHRALAYKWLGIDAGENSNRVGEAIALLTLSSSLLSPSSGLLKRKGQERVGVEAATVEHWLRAYRQLNDTVAFQPVPPVGEVQNKVPAGRAALASKKFSLPTPRFGPGSQGYTGRGFDSEALHALDADHPARANLVGLTTRPTDTYAGHGAYY